MKNYFLSIAAIVLAISFSAFNFKAPEKLKTDEQYLHWYYIQSNGKIGLPVDGSDLNRRADVLFTVGCPGETGDDCARGYIDTQTFDTDAPGVDDSDEHIMKDEF